MHELQRPDSIPGYVHPETTNTNRSNVYKTFTEGGQGRKFGTTSVSKNSYAGYGNSYGDVSEDDMCPMCKESAVEVCPCVYSDKKCANGHTWYTNRNKRVMVGNPHQSK